MASEWHCVPREYEITRNFLQGMQTYEHPLKSSGVTMVDSKGTRGNPRHSFASNSSSRTSSSVSLLTEPLGMALDGTDPLSQFARLEQELKSPLGTSYEQTKKSKRKTQEKEVPDEDPLNWRGKRLGILNRFTTSEKLSISTSFLSAGSVEAGNLASGDIIKRQTVVADKVKYRLEQLDNFEHDSMRHMMNLTQQEYIQRIEQLNSELVQSWHSDQRVKALKIAIQCSKILADTSVLQFYPSQFVLITDVLDIFGKLVWDRLSAKASCVAAVDKDQRKPNEEALRESARETCQNWFYKIASIRELLPRLYVEMAIIKCYSFISHGDFDEALMRITRMIRGIGDPLIATYARCYLVRVGLSVTQKNTAAFLHANIQDFLKIYAVIFSGAQMAELARQGISAACYLSLFGPALDFMLQALVHTTSIYTEEILIEAQHLRNNGPFVMAIMHAFKPEYIATNALQFVQLIVNSNTEGISKAQLLRALGSSVCICPPIPEQREDVFGSAIMYINLFTDPAEYIGCVEAWTPFVAQYFTLQNLNTLLGEINERMSLGKAYEKHYAQLQGILVKIVDNCKDLQQLLVQDNFLPFIDLFHKESVRVEVCKHILTVCKQRCELEHSASSDAVLRNALMHIGKILNDSVNAQTVEDERRQISSLISSFIRQVNFEREFEQQLSFYVEARAAFANLDAVYTTLVHAVNRLAMETHQIVGGNHTRKTATFLRACIAYCFITIPSIVSVQTQMQLYLLTGQVALVNQCLGQADANLEAALQLVPELPRSLEMDGSLRSSEPYLVSYLCNMLATLVVVPDSPEQGVLYLLRLLLDSVSQFSFDPQSTGPSTIYLQALDLLYVQSLEEFPYHIPNVVSNDELYGHDPKFLAEIDRMCAEVVEQILLQLKSLGTAKQLRSQATISLELFLRMVRYADLSKESIFQLALNLWLLAHKQQTQIEKFIDSTRKSVEEIYQRLREEGNDERIQALGQLLKRMKK